MSTTEQQLKHQDSNKNKQELYIANTSPYITSNKKTR